MIFADAFDPIRALTSAWKLVGRSPAPLLVGGALLTLFDDSPWTVTKINRGDAMDLIPFLIGLGLCCGVIGLLLKSWLSVGLANATTKTLIEGSARFDDLFESKGRFFDMLLVRVLQFLIAVATVLPIVFIVVAGAVLGNHRDIGEALIVLTVIGSVLVWLPIFLFVNLGFSLATFAVAIEGQKPTEALRRSWEIVRGNRLRLLVYWIVLWLFTLIGFCACCIGVLFTGALSHVATNESYLQLLKPAETATPPAMPVA